MERLLPHTQVSIPGLENIVVIRSMRTYITILLALTLLQVELSAQQKMRTGVLVVGGGTSGIAAAIQSARMGIPTILTEETTWLGGMLTAAGVSAIDGNHNMPSGIWNEFRDAIYKVYGGPQKVATGWVSNTHFEPHIGDSIFKAMAAKLPNLTILYQTRFTGIVKAGRKVNGATFNNDKGPLLINAQQTIDATELGDVLAAAGAAHDIGLEAGSVTGENVGIERSVPIIQDLTYVAILKDFGKGADMTIARPANYSPAEFDGSNTSYYRDSSRKAPNVDAQKMLDYGKLPNGKYMLNWPAYGNDYYVNMIGMTDAQRAQAIAEAKEQTLRFVYFIQHELGFRHLGLATDEFPTSDHLALMPYHRESRRVKGLVRFNIRHIADPFAYSLYRTGIAVGDYPIDHHHRKNAEAPQHIDFYPIPSYNVPLGSLIPQNNDGLIVAEKSISVSNVVNGSTRLQPVVLQLGQAAGTLAALAIRAKTTAAKVPVRTVQTQLLASKVMLMPYIDAGIHHPQFNSIQRIGATGILRGKGIPYKWANQTRFYPDSTLTEQELLDGLQSFDSRWLKGTRASGQVLTTQKACEWVSALTQTNKGIKRVHSAEQLAARIKEQKLYSENITRKTMAWLLDEYLRPFDRNLSHSGKLHN